MKLGEKEERGRARLETAGDWALCFPRFRFLKEVCFWLSVVLKEMKRVQMLKNRIENKHVLVVATSPSASALSVLVRPSNRIDANLSASTMSISSPPSHPHTSHYLQSILRAHRLPSIPSTTSSPLSVPSLPSPPPSSSDTSESDDPPPPPSEQDSASSLSSSPTKESISSSVDGGSSVGGEGGATKGGGRGGGEELAAKVITLLDEEDEETLKELLRDELGLGYETKVCIISIFWCRNPLF